MAVLNGPARSGRYPRSRLMASAVAVAAVAGLAAATVAARPAEAHPANPAAVSAGCTPSVRGQVVSTVALVRLSRTDVAAELQGLGLLGTARYGVETHRVVYCTVSPSGSGTTASGLLALPQGRSGTLPVMLYEHSTVTAKTDTPSFLQGTESRAVPFLFASDGFAVVAPDYLGLGVSPGRHPYLHAATEASASLDMLRAAATVSGHRGARLSHGVFISGFSQGGQAAMAAARTLQSGGRPWRPAAVAPIAGPYDLSGAETSAVLDPDRTNPQHASVYMAFIFTAWKNLYHLYADPRQVFTAPYADTVEGLFDGSHSFTEIDAALPAPAELFRPEILALINHPSGRYAAALRANDVCRWAPSAPIRLYASPGDRDVTIANAEQCRRQITARGGTAQLIDMGGVDHVGTAIASLPLVRTWFSQLAASTTNRR